MTTLDFDDIDERSGMFIWGLSLLAATLLLIVVLLGVRLWNKAGADIRAAGAQERIASAVERYQPSVPVAPSPCSTWRPAGGF